MVWFKENVITATYDNGEIKFWDVTTGECMRTLGVSRLRLGWQLFIMVYHWVMVIEQKLRLGKPNGSLDISLFWSDIGDREWLCQSC